MLIRELAAVYRRAHNVMRSIDGLQPQEAFDELLKYLFYKQISEESGHELKVEAKDIRIAFSKYLADYNSWSTTLWRDKNFHLSDSCLEQCHALFSEIEFSVIDYDIRSAALREFLTADVRKGLGIYLTPDEVVREIVRFVEPKPTAKCLDPACGSGTFLIELVKHWKSSKPNFRKCKVWGVDKNPRMFLIAELNLGHFSSVTFSRQLMDSLTEPNTQHPKDWCRPEYFDFILTNPPFGVTVDTDQADYVRYNTVHNESGLPRPRQASEWLFIEQSLQWLKPGGTLAIVLPKSVLTNPSSAIERRVIAKIGFLKAVIILPPETFQVTGTQTNTIVAFIQKYRTQKEREKKTSVVVATLSNVGYDSTGRTRTGSQLDGLANHMKNPTASKAPFISVITNVAATDSLGVLSTEITSKRRANSGIPLGDLTEVITTGKTPPRAVYSENKGLFLIKVGNLTGTGINWIARDRNFIDVDNIKGKKFRTAQRVKFGDILLTSSAHSPVYIAKKVDIISTIPSWVGGSASFVGEVMLVRVKSEVISPMMLLGFLRQPRIAAEIQSMVRGQTAHLHSHDLAELRIPEELINSEPEWKSIETILTEETSLNARLNELARQQQETFERLANIKVA